MKKNIWIINHYAGQMYFEKGMRHYWIAKYLKTQGYNPVVFCSNSIHNSHNDLYFSFEKSWQAHDAEEIGVPFIFIKTRPYSNNGKQRVLNMIDFYKNLLKNFKSVANEYGKPDIIYASSVHPLALVAGIKIAKRFGIKCISEIRDLWPESLVAYGLVSRNSLVTKALYAGEKWIYKKSDKIVMTWPGGYDYIRDRGWSKLIPQEKVVHISNGTDLDEYYDNINLHKYNNPVIDNSEKIRIVYTGSIRKVNNVGMLIDAVDILKKMNVNSFQLFLFGDGDERSELEQAVRERKIDNVIFMGRVPKKEIPNILTKADINILHNSSTLLDRYGQSQNKFFEYLASGRPILMTYSVGYSIVKEKRCGWEVSVQTPENIAYAISEVCSLPKLTIDEYGNNAKKTALEYDFKNLSKKVMKVVESL